jgi:hypothetical protein
MRYLLGSRGKILYDVDDVRRYYMMWVSFNPGSLNDHKLTHYEIFAGNREEILSGM